MPPLGLMPNQPSGFPDIVSFGYGSGSTPRPKTYQDTLQEQTDAGNAWLASPVGQKWNEAKESEARRAREVADADIAAKKRALDIQVQQLRQAGRHHEAEMKLREGDLALSRERLAVETEIKRAELGLEQQRFGLEQEDFGLRRAEAIAKYQQGPDTLFVAKDLRNALERVGAGLGPGPYGAGTEPTARTPADFEGLMAGGTGAGGSMRGSGQMTAGGQVAGPGPSGEAAAPDPRVKAATGVIKALGFNDDDGIDESTAAALAAVQNIARARKPGTSQRLASRPGLQAGFMAGASKAGYYAPDLMAEIESWNPGQGSVRSAA